MGGNSRILLFSTFALPAPCSPLPALNQWPGIAERMLEFYDWILNGGKQPDFVV